MGRLSAPPALGSLFTGDSLTKETLGDPESHRNPGEPPVANGPLAKPPRPETRSSLHGPLIIMFPFSWAGIQVGPLFMFHPYVTVPTVSFHHAKNLVYPSRLRKDAKSDNGASKAVSAGEPTRLTVAASAAANVMTRYLGRSRIKCPYIRKKTSVVR